MKIGCKVRITTTSIFFLPGSTTHPYDEVGTLVEIKPESTLPMKVKWKHGHCYYTNECLEEVKENKK